MKAGRHSLRYVVVSEAEMLQGVLPEDLEPYGRLDIVQLSARTAYHLNDARFLIARVTQDNELLYDKDDQIGELQ